MRKIKLTFLGGVGTVTGSKYLLDDGHNQILVDCGLFQGFKQLRLRNWAALPITPSKIDGVILTHAHIDHSGYLPLLVKNGFRGPIFATPATQALCDVLLPDSGYLQERDADFANRYGFSKHKPAKPLYTQADAETSLEQFEMVPFNTPHEIGGLTFKMIPAGHILGAASVEVKWNGRTLVFSGDLGRFDHPFMNPPSEVRHADYVVMESTYGNRSHSKESPDEALKKIIVETASRGGTIVIPAFAVGRAQEILFHIHNLKKSGQIPDLPVYLDSPMAIDASDIFCTFTDSHCLSREQARAICATATYVRHAEDSKSLDSNGIPKIIISASGMATGGRVLHHIKKLATDHRNALVFVGFQASGTRGEALVTGAESVKIHGQYVSIKAEVHNLSMLSAHGDANDLIRWLSPIKTPPKWVYITHGEPNAADMLRRKIEERYSWNCCVPDYLQSVTLH